MRRIAVASWWSTAISRPRLNLWYTVGYGAYVIGSDWRFMVLEGRHYTISRDYSALSDEIFDILRILKALKAIILDRTADSADSKGI